MSGLGRGLCSPTAAVFIFFNVCKPAKLEKCDMQCMHALAAQ